MNTINKAIAGIAIVASLAATASAQVVGSTATNNDGRQEGMTATGFILGSTTANFGSNLLFALADDEYLEMANNDLIDMNIAAGALSATRMDDDEAYNEFAKVIEQVAEEISDGDYEYDVVLDNLYGAFDEFMSALSDNDCTRIVWYGYLGFWQGYAELVLNLHDLDVLEPADVQDSLQVFVELATIAADDEDSEVKRVVAELANLAGSEKFGKKQLEATYELIEELWTIIVGEC